jgi:predicted nucleotidyltransferase
MTKATLSRQLMIDTLHKRLAAEDFVLAAWLGGSDATGRTDEYSDIDLQVIVEDENVEKAFELMHAAVESLSPIEHRYRFPEPTWHGHSQELLRLEGADPNHFLDFVVMRKSVEDRLLETERHGTPLILFDRDGLLKPPPMNWEEHGKKMARRFSDLRVQFPLLQPLVTRGIHRGQIAESAYAYQVLTIKPLVEVLRMRYCPERFDYGIRYIDRDLPAAWREEIERLAYPRAADLLLSLHRQAVEHFNSVIEAYDRAEWEIPSRRRD